MDELLEKYYIAKNKLRDLEELLKYYKEEIETHLEKEGVDRIKTNRFTVDRRTLTIERMSKKSCPSEVWNDYASSMTTHPIYVKKNGERRRSRSRERYE